jgi:HSP20 family molecular chaperone IbpA
MTTPARRQSRFPFPDLPDWMEAFQPRLGWHPLADWYGMRIEEDSTEDRYIVRVELPGIDPDKDLEVTVESGMLTIKAERAERTEGKRRSEFRYGSFSRTVELPPGANEDEVRAEYTDGILTISIGLGEEKTPTRRIEVRRQAD